MIEIQTITGGNIGTNCYLIKDDKNIILVDFVPEVENIIKSNNYNLEKILLTHIHFDHFEMLSDFQTRYNFELVISEFGYNNINNTEYNLLTLIPEVITSQINKVDLAKATIIKENDIIKWNDHEISVFESPGHSKDSLMFIFDELKCVFSGDTIFYQSIGRTDFKGSNSNDIIKSIMKLFSKINDNYIIYPGHGPETKVDFEKKYNPFLN